MLRKDEAPSSLARIGRGTHPAGLEGTVRMRFPTLGAKTKKAAEGWGTQFIGSERVGYRPTAGPSTTLSMTNLWRAVVSQVFRRGGRDLGHPAPGVRLVTRIRTRLTPRTRSFKFGVTCPAGHFLYISDREDSLHIGPVFGVVYDSSARRSRAECAAK